MKKMLLAMLTSFALISCSTKVETKSSNSLSSSQPSSLEGSSNESSSSSNASTSLSKSLPNVYKVRFQNYDGTLLYQTEVEEGKSAVYVGETPTKPVEEGKTDYTYEFAGWDKELNSILEDTIATAIFEVKTQEGWGSIAWF